MRSFASVLAAVLVVAAMMVLVVSAQTTHLGRDPDATRPPIRPVYYSTVGTHKTVYLTSISARVSVPPPSNIQATPAWMFFGVGIGDSETSTYRAGVIMDFSEGTYQWYAGFWYYNQNFPFAGPNITKAFPVNDGQAVAVSISAGNTVVDPGAAKPVSARVSLVSDPSQYANHDFVNYAGDPYLYSTSNTIATIGSHAYFYTSTYQPGCLAYYHGSYQVNINAIDIKWAGKKTLNTIPPQPVFDGPTWDKYNISVCDIEMMDRDPYSKSFFTWYVNQQSPVPF